MARNDGGQAFPTQRAFDPARPDHEWPGTEGMSLRDWFAGQALVGLLSGDSEDLFCDIETLEEAVDFKTNTNNGAKIAYEYAEAMLRASEAP